MSQQADDASPYAALLPDYLTVMAEKLYFANQQRREEITSGEQWQARQQQLREYFTAALGGFPERTPLNPDIAGTIDCGPFTIEKTILQSHPNFLVTASLYVPKDLDGKVPGILVPCGHSANGRMAQPYQAVGIAMALNGFVALIYDPISQGERVQYYDAGIGDSTVGPCTSEHSQMDNQCDLIGHNIAKYRIYDGMRCLDYLQSRPEVDGERLGCTGCSGGGTLTTYLMALDERIKAAAPVCYLTSLQARQESDMIADGEQNIFGQLAAGLDHHEMAAMTAPRALRICAAEEDYFPLHGAQETAEFCRRTYGLLGVPERFELFVGAGTHGFSPQIRNAAVEWFGRFLDMPTSEVEVDPDPYILPDAQLYCTDTGQVVNATDSRKVYEINLEVFEKQRPDPATVQPQREVQRAVAASVGIAMPIEVVEQKPLEPATIGLEAEEDTDYRLIAAEAGLYAGLFTKKSGPDTKAVRLVVMEEPNYAEFARSTVRDGEDLALLAVCGTGLSDLRHHGRGNFEQRPGNSARLLGREAFAAYFTKIMGFPLLRLRVRDILAAIGFLRDEGGYEQIVLEGRGRGGIWALHAAVLDAELAGVKLQDTLWSYELMIRDGEYTVPHMADIARGCLLYYDLPQMCAALAPTPLEIVNPVDSRGATFDAASTPEFVMLQEAYGEATDNLRIS